jgi:hypothetical protein
MRQHAREGNERAKGHGEEKKYEALLFCVEPEAPENN